MLNLQLVLGSGSPRRKELIANLGIPFRVQTADVDELFPESLPANEVAEYLAQLKANVLIKEVLPKEILITADTVVILDNQVLGKPGNAKEAQRMLQSLSGKKHEVITGVGVYGTHFKKTFSVSTWVEFKQLTNEEIDYYITQFKPYDKAGAYGIQEWIGQIGIEKIEGCFYNVMGLPVGKLWEILKSIPR